MATATLMQYSMNARSFHVNGKFIFYPSGTMTIDHLRTFARYRVDRDALHVRAAPLPRKGRDACRKVSGPPMFRPKASSTNPLRAERHRVSPSASGSSAGGAGSSEARMRIPSQDWVAVLRSHPSSGAMRQLLPEGGGNHAMFRGPPCAFAAFAAGTALPAPWRPSIRRGARVCLEPIRNPSGTLIRCCARFCGAHLHGVNCAPQSERALSERTS